MRQEMFRSVYGAWRIACFDPAAMSHFNLSIDGFWRSFAAMGVVVPFYLIFILLTFGEGPAPEPLPALEWYVVVKLLAFTLSWLAFPLVMVPVSRLLDLTSTYVSYIIAWNWSSVLEMAVVLPAVFLYVSGALPE
ncbi:MAG: hypothetical protein QF578_05420 [Alphaproteobacteria bacterium]|jgi:hypothetical protein|nr:hypothetical protein [Alphaproteobacteria bacterium]MDP6814018.1 hypothetical protein [Alphaproteobacteria bacterium]